MIICNYMILYVRIIIYIFATVDDDDDDDDDDDTAVIVMTTKGPCIDLCRRKFGLLTNGTLNYPTSH